MSAASITWASKGPLVQPAARALADVVPAAELVQVGKHYALGQTDVTALHGVNLSIEAGSFTVISGPSGSGKTTLLNVLGCLHQPTHGMVYIGGTDVATLPDKALSAFRARHIGFVFQHFNLLPVLSALENVEYPLQLIEPHADVRRERAMEALKSVGLEQLALRRPAELSGGQRQRVAIARALVKQPTLVIADEPTANLDQKTGAELIALMREMQHRSGTTFVFSSHDPQLLADADERVHIVDGRVVEPVTASRAANLHLAKGASHEHG